MQAFSCAPLSFDMQAVLARSAELLAAASAARTDCQHLCEMSEALRRDTALASEFAIAQVVAPALDRARRKARVYLRWVAAGRLAQADACDMVAADLLDAGLGFHPATFLSLEAANRPRW